MKFFLTPFLLLSAASLHISVFYTSLTANSCTEISSYLTSSSTLISNFLVSSVQDIQYFTQDLHTDIFLDCISITLWSYELAYISQSMSVFHLQLYSQSRLPHSQSLSLIPSSSYSSSCLQSVLDNLSFQEFITIYTSDYLIPYANIIHQSSLNLPLGDFSTTDYISKQLKTNVKYSKYNTIVLLSNRADSDLILQAASSEGMTDGYRWILGNSNGYLHQLSSNNTQITEGLCILDSYPYDFPSAVSSAISSLSNCTSHLQYSTYTLQHCIESFYSIDFTTRSLAPKMTLNNLVNSEIVLVGNIDSSGYDTIQDIIWTTQYEQSARKVIQFAHDGGTVSPSGDSLDFLSLSYNGVDLAVSYINDRHEILPGFMLEKNLFNFGTAYFDEEFALKELNNKRNQLQTALIAPAFSGVAMNVYKLLERENTLIPMIGYANTATKLSSPVEFPYYSRTSVPDSFITVILNLAIMNWGWKQVAVIYVDNAFAGGLNSDFESEAMDRGLTITNQGKNKLPASSESWTSEVLDPVLHEVGMGNSRILVVFCVLAEVKKIILRMDELGYSKNQYQYIAVGWLMTELINENTEAAGYDPDVQNVIRKSLRGSIMFFPKNFHGDLGEQIKEMYKETFKDEPGSYTGFAFDAVLALGYALNKMLLKGEDLHDNSLIMREIREVKFLGATGYVSIATGTNDRAPMDHIIVNTKQTAENTWEIREVGVFSPSSTRMLDYFEDIVWSDGTTTLPSDKLSELDCPFSESLVQTSDKSKELMVMYSLFIVMCTVIPVLLSYNGWKHINYHPITHKFLMTFNDIICLSTIPIDFLQTIGLLPNLNLFFSRLSLILYTSVLDYGEMFDDTSKYYHIYVITISIIFLSFLYRSRPNLRAFFPSGKSVLYMISDILFIPILIFLKSILKCSQSIGSELTDAYFEYDCYTYCYKGKHLTFIIPGAVCTCLYTLWVSFERAEFPERNSDSQHFMIQPKFSRFRNLNQAVLVFLYSTLRNDDHLMYIGCVGAVAGIQVLLIWKIRPYNCEIFNVIYEVVTVWTVCVVIGVLLKEMEITSVYSCIIGISCFIIVSSTVGGLHIIKNKYTLPFLSNSDKTKKVLRFAFRRTTVQDVSDLGYVLETPVTRKKQDNAKVVPFSF